MTQPVYQDGGQFYAEGGRMVADYGRRSAHPLVAHDFDTEGAIRARAQFLKDWGTLYHVAPPPEPEPINDLLLECLR